MHDHARRARTPPSLIAVHAMLIVALAGCGSTVEGIAEDAIGDQLGGTVDINGDAYTVTDDTGTMRISQQVPADLGIPLLNGATVQSAMERTVSDGTAYVVELRYPVDRYDEIVRFYETYAAGLEDTVTRTSAGDNSTVWRTEREPRTAIEVRLDATGVTVILGMGL